MTAPRLAPGDHDASQPASPLPLTPAPARRARTSAPAPAKKVVKSATRATMPRQPTAKQQTGQNGEDQALTFLQEKGMKLVARNFRCKMGEIDLIMRERHTLVFVEVRKRAPGRFGGAADSITHAKQRKLVLAAQLYLLRFATPPICRFDVIAIDGGQLSWIQNAIDT